MDWFPDFIDLTCLFIPVVFLKWYFFSKRSLWLPNFFSAFTQVHTGSHQDTKSSQSCSGNHGAGIESVLALKSTIIIVLIFFLFIFSSPWNDFFHSFPFFSYRLLWNWIKKRATGFRWWTAWHGIPYNIFSTVFTWCGFLSVCWLISTVSHDHCDVLINQSINQSIDQTEEFKSLNQPINQSTYQSRDILSIPNQSINQPTAVSKWVFSLNRRGLGVLIGFCPVLGDDRTNGTVRWVRGVNRAWGLGISLKWFFCGKFCCCVIIIDVLV